MNPLSFFVRISRSVDADLTRMCDVNSSLHHYSKMACVRGGTLSSLVILAMQLNVLTRLWHSRKYQHDQRSLSKGSR